MKPMIITFLCSLCFLCLAGLSDEKPGAVLYVFEGSDWCTNCARFEKRILVDQSFQSRIGLLNIKLERIDFPQRKKLPVESRKQNDRVAEKFGFDGVFPSLIIVRPDNEMYRRIYYKNENVDEILRLIMENLALLYE